MRGLDSSANAEIVEMSLPSRALPPNQTTGPNAGGGRHRQFGRYWLPGWSVLPLDGKRILSKRDTKHL